MKKIGILIDADYIGGAETNFRFILPGLYEHGYESMFVTHGSDNIGKYFKDKKIPVKVNGNLKKYHSLSHNGMFSIKNSIKTLVALISNYFLVRKMINRESFDVVISNSMMSHFLLSILHAFDNKSNTRYVMHLHDIVDRSKVFGLYGLVLDQIVSHCDKCIVCSNAVADRINVKTNKVVTIYNPISLNHEDTLMSLRREKTDRIRIGFFSRYTPWKGHDELLKILDTIHCLNVEFVTYGNNTDKSCFDRFQEKFENMAKRKGINVQVNGFVSNVYQKMISCDVVLLLSTSPDPAPLALFESSSLGIPILAYDTGGVRELFEKFNLIGEVVEQGDYLAISNKICSFQRKKYNAVANLESLSPSKFVESYMFNILNG